LAAILAVVCGAAAVEELTCTHWACLASDPLDFSL
jgi:hypothetical protein